MQWMKDVLIKILTAVHRVLSSSLLKKYYRTLMFDLHSADSLVVFNGKPERFIVAASDKIIGKRTFVNELPFEFEQLHQVRELLGQTHKRTVFIDIGANIGTVCIAAIKRGLFERAIAIEPEPRNFSLLMANIHLNNLAQKISAHNIAFGEHDNQTLNFELSKYNFGDHRVRLNNEAGYFDEINRDIIRVRSETFDSVIEITEPDTALIWIDTQGFEGYVLSGASKALSHCIPICLEFWPYGLDRAGCYAKLKSALLGSCYKFFYDLAEPTKQVPLSVESLDALYKKLSHPEGCANLLII